MDMDNIRFGTGGWRAVIGEDFNKENIYRVGAAVAEYLIQENKTDKPIFIGYDRRFLSKESTVYLAQVLVGRGFHVLLTKRSIPTPLTMHTVKVQNLYLGLEVTASHNPFSFNGIKVIVDEGRDAPVEVTERLEKILSSGLSQVDNPKTVSLQEAVSSGFVSYVDNPFNSFIDDIIAKLDMAAIRNRGLRIALDPMHGSGTYPLQVILFTARCTLDLIHSNKDAFFGGSLPAPTKEGLAELSYKVKTE
ncbi:MAG: phosphoglucomutase/phosphomannomutase family protein, partial [Sphaerochaetaceae bacterium]|nr:phosphoglucomutase/phosphomannomutase family protein [Sphaerochaetaceae bacterium]